MKPVKIKIVAADDPLDTSMVIVENQKMKDIVPDVPVMEPSESLLELVQQIHRKHNAHFSLSFPRKGDLRLQVHGVETLTFKAPDLASLLQQALA